MKANTIFRIFILSTILTVCYPIHAQRLDQIVPESPAVRHGVLKNGMVYYICKIPKEKKSSFYVIQRTGSLVEQEDEHGLAHFVEHLVFCGTKNYKKHAIIDFVRSTGSEFGKDLNAGTGHEFTFYKFEDIAVRNDSVLDNCLLMLRDMMYEAEMNEEDIEKERNVIIEETLMRGDMENISLFEGTPFSFSVIGDTSNIRNCPAQKIRDFYHRWYQPQMQAIVVMHPSDVDTMLVKIKDIFEIIPRGDAEIPERLTLPTLEMPRISIEHDKYQEESTKIKLRLLQRPTDIPKNTIGYYLVNNVVSEYFFSISMTFHRLDSLGISCSISREKWNNSQIFEITARSDKENPLSVLRSFLSTVKSIRLFGLPDSISKKYYHEVVSPEIRGSIIEWKPVDSVLSEKDYQPSQETFLSAFSNPIFEKCKDHFLYGEPIIDSETENQIYSYFRKTIDAKEMQRMFNQFFTSSNHYYDITIPQSLSLNLTEEDVLEVIEDVDRIDAVPLILPVKKEERQPNANSFLSSEIIPGAISSDRRITDGSVREIILSNGVKVLINKVDSSEYGEFNAFRVGGYGLHDLKHKWMLGIIESCFEGKGRRISCLRESGHDQFHLSCIYDWEEDLKKIHTELVNTELDTALIRRKWAEEWNHERSEAGRFLRKISIPSDNVIQIVDSVPTSSDIAEILNIWKHHKSNYNDMVVAIDCITEEDSIIPLIQKYLGSLPSKREPLKLYNHYYFIQHDSVVVDSVVVDSLEHHKQGFLILGLFQERNLSYTSENFILHKTLEYLLKNHLVDFMRLKNGDIYSLAVDCDIRQFSHPHQVYKIMLALSPSKKDKIEQDMEDLIHEMAYGNIIEQRMIEDFITTLQAKGGYYPTGSKAVQLMDEIRQQGVVIDTRKMNLKEIITIDAVKGFLQNLLEKGNRYKYMMVPKVETLV